MSIWSQGYPTDTGYIDSIQPMITPTRWAQSMAFAGRSCPDPASAFRFLELGCGSAVTLIGLAACYPQATFVGYDYMPEHVLRAQDLIDAAGLDNVTVHEASFAEMAKAPPDAPFDFAAAHGVWTWVPQEVRQELVEVLNAWLAPGGVTYFGYNAAAGWGAAGPLRMIFRNARPGPPDDRFGPARQGADRWLEHLGQGVPQVKAIWKTFDGASDSLLAHELASPHGTGIWLDDIAGPLSEAKMDFAGPAVLAEHMDALFLENAHLALLRDAVADGWGEIARDLLHWRTMRKDLFHRGAPAMPNGRMIEHMRALRVAPWDPKVRVGTHPSVYQRLRQTLPPEIIEALHAAAEAPDATFGSCMDAVPTSPEQAFQATIMALISGQLIDLRSEAVAEAAAESCARFNRIMLERLQAGEKMPGLVSPHFGGCLQIALPEHLEVLQGKAEDPDFLRHMARLGLAFD